MRAVRALGLRVPADLSLAGFDDFEWAAMLDPPVTVVDQDIAAIGKAAGTFLLRRLKEPKAEASEELVLKPSLRIRRSCGCGPVAGT